MNEGEPAPFTGDLYPIDVSIRFALEIEGCAERAALELDHARQLHQIELAKVHTLTRAAADAGQRRLDLVRTQLEAARVWYRSPAFAATVATVATVAILLTSTVLVQATAEVRH